MPAAPSNPAFSALPGWITPEVIAETRAVWQPDYKEELTDEEVVRLLLNVGNAFRILKEGYDKKRRKQS